MSSYMAESYTEWYTPYGETLPLGGLNCTLSEGMPANCRNAE